VPLCLLAPLAAAFLSVVVFPGRYEAAGYWRLAQPILIGWTYAVMLSLIRDYFSQKGFRKEIEQQRLKNEIDALQAQINPHFLFNSLSYLYGSALKEKANSTAEGIASLSEMMRYSVQEVRETFVSLEKEIQFIENYLRLFQDRLPPSVNGLIKTRIEVAPNALRIPPLILIPFIENAFKYGISVETPMPIEIAIVLMNNSLTLEISNYIFRQASVKSTNTGNNNSARRLKLLYPDKHSLRYRNREQKFEVELTILLD
jgi:LytS/YehU family sensor histidine kinase